jgi:hypothetical protein
MQQNPVPFLDREQVTLAPQLGTLYVRVRESQTQLISKLLDGDVGSLAYPASWAKYFQWDTAGSCVSVEFAPIDLEDHFSVLRQPDVFSEGI